MHDKVSRMMVVESIVRRLGSGQRGTLRKRRPVAAQKRKSQEMIPASQQDHGTAWPCFPGHKSTWTGTEHSPRMAVLQEAAGLVSFARQLQTGPVR